MPSSVSVSFSHCNSSCSVFRPSLHIPLLHILLLWVVIPASQGQMGGKKRCRRMRKKVRDEPDVVFLGEKVSEAEKVEHVSGPEATAGASGAGGAPSSSSKSKGTKRSSSGGGLKGKRDAENDDVVCLGESIDERESFLVPPPREVIEIVDSDDNDDDDDDNDNDNAHKEGKKRSENDEFDDAADVEQIRGSYVSSDKAAESFGDGECGWGPENPIRIDFVEGNENEEGSKDDESGLEVYSSPSSDTSDNDKSSDKDFQADAREGSSSEDDSSSYDEEEEKERIGNSKKQKERSEPWARKISRFDEGTSSSMDQGRKVPTGSSAVCKKNGESPASLKKKD